jgi:hypothetical protein
VCWNLVKSYILIKFVEINGTHLTPVFDSETTMVAMLRVDSGTLLASERVAYLSELSLCDQSVENSCSCIDLGSAFALLGGILERTRMVFVVSSSTSSTHFHQQAQVDIYVTVLLDLALQRGSKLGEEGVSQTPSYVYMIEMSNHELQYCHIIFVLALHSIPLLVVLYGTSPLQI